MFQGIEFETPHSTTIAQGHKNRDANKGKYILIITIFGCPAAAITISASRIILSGWLVCECTVVTVASAFKSSNEAGKPTMLLLPTTTALFPFIVTPLRCNSSRHACTNKNVNQILRDYLKDNLSVNNLDR